ncbi:hemerythrin domain-containing protein [Actinotalea solisilvae]|uniref:hemerythrin domain-containing protein n=1 Tax=Actinotalea solisilvae TaxID=2072922 RepID=UPI0018F13BEC|nr:hemerythrin domain-containing protein [Actinotalea solisilvae]
MREVHRRLRDAIDLARVAVEEEHAAPSAAPDPLLYCWGFCAALSGHHRSEDGALFPRVVRAHPELASVLAQLVQDHAMIEHLIGELRRAEDAPTEEMLRHLDGIEAVMLTHFRYEELRLLPILDAMNADDLLATDPYGPLA